GGILRHRDWGMYEFAVGAPDGLLVRIGWPSSLVGAG
ncbi:MAG: glyoxalase, partial [Hyphomonadaceae bacterium]